jgi:hypothetical protein
MPTDQSGNYTLPDEATVTTGTTISSDANNITVSDLEQGINDRLWGGGGSFDTPVKFSDGSVGAPGITWTNAPNTGLYRAATGEQRLTFSGVDVMQAGANGLQVWKSAFWYDVQDASGLTCTNKTADTFKHTPADPVGGSTTVIEGSVTADTLVVGTKATVPAPAADTDAATKKYVDDTAAITDDVNTWTKQQVVTPRTVAGTAIDFNVDQATNITLAADRTLTFSNALAGGVYTFHIVNQGSWDITWPPAVQWSGGVTPVITPNGYDLVTMYFNGLNYLATIAQDFQ